VTDHSLVIGLDLGTSGARALAMNFEGERVAEGRSSLSAEATRVAGDRVEQDPAAWSAVVCNALGQLAQRLPAAHHIAALAVDATSGTFLIADERNRPLTPGIMYNDLRAAGEAEEVAEQLHTDLSAYGIRIAPSFALPKIVHLLRHSGESLSGRIKIVHQTDWVVGLLCGRYDVSDISTALKTGADPGRMAWPEAIERLGVPRQSLPQLVTPGTAVGTVTEAAAERTGLPAGVTVVAGCTDGTAGCLASGARATGDLNVTLGSTLVFKAVADAPLVDPQGAVYNHRHPAGGYLPGAASSTGGEWVEKYFAASQLESLNTAAEEYLPTQKLTYPLMKRGERFPFVCTHAQGFGLPQQGATVEHFASAMEGVAFIERMGIARLGELGLTIGPNVYATGGGVGGTTWLRIRAAVNRRIYHVPRYAECAVGAAVLAAIPTTGSCAAASQRLVTSGRIVEPDEQLAAAYDGPFARFQEALSQRGYV
jgi:sugar (pentulose or hexulose) kinase